MASERDGDELPAAIGGTVAAGFEGVRDAFARNFAEHGEVGAACAVYVDGRPVVDVWGGVADAATGEPYRSDTLQLIFSSTKGATALCANLLAQRGELDIDAPVAAVWPDFAAAGKDGVTVRHLLCHQAGLPYVEAALTLEQALAWDPPVEALAAQAPLWEPGTAHGYHAVTFGWLVGEVIRRASGRSPGTFFADEVARPLGLDMWIGLPDEQQARVAPLTTAPPARRGAGARAAAGMEEEAAGGRTLTELVEQLLGPDSLLARALAGTDRVFVGDGVFNRPDVRAAELPAANGVADARSLARLYAATIGPVEAGGEAAAGRRRQGAAGGQSGGGQAGGSAGEAGGRPAGEATVGPLLGPDQVAAASTCQTSGGDQVLLFPTTFGLGYMAASSFTPLGGPGTFGHFGAGGSVGFADPRHGVGFAYVMNRMVANLAGDPRSHGLIRATYDALGVSPASV